MTHTGPYDSISDTQGRRSGSSVRLKLPLPALHLLRCFRRCLLPTSSHCCPPSHGSWRVCTARIGNRHALHSIYYSTAKKTALPLNEAGTHARSDTMRGRQAPNSNLTVPTRL